jgi:hypothetical protein
MVSMKYDSANDTKRPLRLECRGGPFPFMRCDEAELLKVVAIRDETGGRGPNGFLPVVGEYHLKGSVYEYVVPR